MKGFSAPSFLSGILNKKPAANAESKAEALVQSGLSIYAMPGRKWQGKGCGGGTAGRFTGRPLPFNPGTGKKQRNRCPVQGRRTA
jgi:hypothetical protein